MRRFSPYNYNLDNPIYIYRSGWNGAKGFHCPIAKDGAAGHDHMGGVIQDGSGKYFYVTFGAAENAVVNKMFSSGVQGGFNVTPLTGAESMEDAN